MRKKILIIRFSSFGDIVQSLSSVNYFAGATRDCDIFFLTKKEFAAVAQIHPYIKEVWRYDKKSGIIGLLKLAIEIRDAKFDLIYDAHATMRTALLKVMLRFIAIIPTFRWIKRSKNRWRRFQFFTLKKREAFSLPFKGALSYIEPLQSLEEFSHEFNFSCFIAWSFTKQMEADLFRRFLDNILPDQHFITLAPSAAWEMKRWPLENWKKIIELLPTFQFLVLGGPDDSFCQEIKEVAPFRTINSAGQATLLESCCLVFLSEFVISGDTGILHVADLFHIDGLALIGPTAFGHPTGDSLEVLESSLSCRPCSKDGRGSCSQDTFQKCMVDLTPELISNKVKEFFKDLPSGTRPKNII